MVIFFLDERYISSECTVIPPGRKDHGEDNTGSRMIKLHLLCSTDITINTVIDIYTMDGKQRITFVR